jgi:hypothetical protein
MDVQAQLAKAVQARFRQMNGIEEPTPPASTMREKVKVSVTIPKADPAVKSAAAAALASKFGKAPNGGPPCSSNKKVLSSKSGSGSGGPLSSDDEALAAQYRKMMKFGMPEGAVRHKMMADGVTNHIVEAVMKGDEPGLKNKGGGNGGETSTGGSLSPEEEQIASQYRKMSKVGMPEGAIRHKMNMDGVAPKIQDAVFAAEQASSSSGDGGGGLSRGGGGSATSSLSVQEEQIASQYRRMIKVGMPEGAVRHKMTADGVSTKIQDSVIAGESAGAPSSSLASSGGAAGGLISTLSPEEEAIASQYRRMMKIKLPQGAIIQKMTMAGVAQNIQDSVLKGEAPSSQPATSTSNALPVNPLAAMIASAGGIGSLKAAAPVEKSNEPSGMSGNPLAAAIAASGGMASLKKSALNEKPAKSSSGAGGLLGELTASGFTGSLKKSATKDRAPPKPSSSGGLLGELTASGFKGSLRKSDHRPAPPKPSSSGGLLGELSASGFKGSLKKTPENRSSPLKSASTGNTDFHKLLEDRRKRAAEAAESLPPRTKLPPSSNGPTIKAGQPMVREDQHNVSQNDAESPKKNASGSSGFDKPLARVNNSSAVATVASTPPPRQQQAHRQTPHLPLSTQNPPKFTRQEEAAEASPPAKPVETVRSPLESHKDQLAKTETKKPQEPDQAPTSPQKIAKSPGSHISTMLNRRQQDKAQSPSASPVKQESARIEKAVVASPSLATDKVASVPVKTRVIQTEAQVPPALVGLSKPSRPTQAEIPVPPALASTSKPFPAKVPAPLTLAKSEPPHLLQAKVSLQQSPKDLSSVASGTSEIKSFSTPRETKEPIVPTVTKTTTIPAVHKASAPSVPVVDATRSSAVAKASPSLVALEAKAVAKVQVNKDVKVTQLENGKQVLDVATTTVKPGGTQAREHKTKTKNSDKKKSKPQDDGVDHHCACVVM